MSKKISELTLKQIIDICQSPYCKDCPLVKRQNDVIAIKLCCFKINDIKDEEVLL